MNILLKIFLIVEAFGIVVGDILMRFREGQMSQEVPQHLQSTCRLLGCAFPHGMTDEQYKAVLHFLHPHMSFRTLAKVLSIVTEYDYYYVLNDAMGYEAKPLVDSAILNSVGNKLRACGYNEWANED
jgi:hypothetical protein